MARAEPQRSELRAMLQAEMRKLPRSLRIAEESSKPVTLDRQSVGRLSRTDALQSQGMSQRLEARDGERMAWLRRALDRLDAGACAICGGDIALDRLAVFPETEGCGRCG